MPSELTERDATALEATAKNPLNGENLATLYRQFLPNGSQIVNETDTDPSGLVTWDWQYPADGTVCTILVNVTRYDLIGNRCSAGQPLNATTWAKTLDGEQYPACTTTQYGYEPAYNTTTLTVLPESTEVLAMTKSPEEMQKQAEQNGTLKLKNEWSWGYPWYRLHMVYLLGAVEQFDVGIGILGGNIVTATNHFTSRINSYARDIAWDLFGDWVAGEVVQALGAWSGIWWVWAGAVIGATIYKGVLLYSQSWNSLEKLQTSYVAQFVSLMVEAGSFIAQFTLGHMAEMMGSLKSFNGAVWAVLTLIANILLDMAFFMNVIDARISELGGS